MTSSWLSGCRKFPPLLLVEYNFGRKSVRAGSSAVIMEAISHLLIHLKFYESIIYDSDLRSCKNEKCPKTQKDRPKSPGLFHFRSNVFPCTWSAKNMTSWSKTWIHKLQVAREHVTMRSHRHTRRLWTSSRLKEKATWSGLAVKYDENQHSAQRLYSMFETQQ